MHLLCARHSDAIHVRVCCFFRAAHALRSLGHFCISWHLYSTLRRAFLRVSSFPDQHMKYPAMVHGFLSPHVFRSTQNLRSVSRYRPSRRRLSSIPAAGCLLRKQVERGWAYLRYMARYRASSACSNLTCLHGSPQTRPPYVRSAST
jgi:hypothetical protein